MQASRRVGWGLRTSLALALISALGTASARAEHKLLAEAEGTPGENATSDRSKQDYVNSLTPDALLFAPGTGLLYSNFGFDLLGAGLGQCRRQSLP